MGGVRNFFRCEVAVMKKRSAEPKGSFTVEAALIFPVILIVILSVMYIDIHLMNTNIFACLACEQAITGNETQPSSSFALKTPERLVSDSENERSVSFNTGTKGIMDIFNFDINVSARYKKTETEKFIRAMRIKNAVDRQGG